MLSNWMERKGSHVMGAPQPLQVRVCGRFMQLAEWGILKVKSAVAG